jgi:N-acetylglucosamine-6-phosphate deacetylase
VTVGDLAAGRVLRPDGTLAPGVIELDGDRIGAIHGGGEDRPDRILAPGFVDLQVNGIGDADVASAEGGDWDRLDAALLAQGVTAWCPTLTTAPLGDYAAPLARIAVAAARPGDRIRPQLIGAHLEGPFLGGAPGAHRQHDIVAPDLDWLAALPDVVRVMTLAPEAPRASDAITALTGRGVLVALGHSTASFEQAEAAAGAGARLVTHLFNAMGGLHHRRPGLVGAALTDDRLTVSVIADGAHLAPPALRLAFRAKPAGGVALVTDAVAWAGPAARGRGVTLVDGAPRLPDGTLAGSALTMDGALRTAVAAGLGLAEALTAASATPARLLGLADRGRLEPGTRADVVALDQDLRVTGVWVGGQVWAGAATPRG